MNDLVGLIDLRRAIALAIGLGPWLQGCGPEMGETSGGNGTDGGTSGATEGASAEGPGSDETGATTNGETSGMTAATDPGTATSDSGKESGETSETSVGGTTDLSSTHGSTGDSGDTGTMSCPDPAPGQYYGCLPAPQQGECGECDAACQQALTNQYNQNPPDPFCSYEVSGIACGPDEVDDACCYIADIVQVVCEGRPWFVHGAVTVAPLAERRDWIRGGSMDAVNTHERVRTQLAAAWLAAAADEHASIAAFAQFIFDLLALGAPPALLRDAQQALADEIAHAELCFTLASRVSGVPRGPGPLPIPIAGAPRTRDAIVRAVVLEGCVAETIAAAEAAIARDATTDPVTRAALTTIAADEQRHAALSWRFVRWALERWPDLRPIVHAAFESALSTPIHLEPSPDLRAHGRLGTAERRALADQTLATVIEPAAKALLHGWRATTEVVRAPC